MADVQAKVQDGHEIAVAQRIPWVGDGVLGKTYVDSCIAQFLDTGQAAAFGIGVIPALEMDVLGGAGDYVDAGTL